MARVIEAPGPAGKLGTIIVLYTIGGRGALLRGCCSNESGSWGYSCSGEEGRRSGSSDMGMD